VSHRSPLISADIHAYLREHERKGLLRFITCGSVDDGKSTLIGRLLHDAGLIYDDHYAAVVKDSARFGTTGDAPDLALLLDGLQSEREQGITIDVAYRYFSTATRKFIVADTPGHEQYTRNMATGASTADLAVILVDARQGVLRQTKRHSHIVTLMGIRQLVLAVNKMDLVGWSQGTFDDIVADYRALLAQLGGAALQLTPIPLSALTGEGVVRTAESAPWVRGPTLLQALEGATPRSQALAAGPLRCPVQYVNRPHADFRGYAGTLASGTLRRGEEVMVMPQRTRARIQRILTFDAELEVACAPQAVTVTLDRQLDVARGDMLVHPERAPVVAERFDADLVWMAEGVARPGQRFELKLGSASTPATLLGIGSRVDPETLARHSASELNLNDIAHCHLQLQRPLPFDPYATLPATGSFILIDPLTRTTLAAGMIRAATPAPRPRPGADLTWSQARVSAAARAAQKGQQPRVLWFTGLSGAGKSTLANALDQRLHELGHHSYLLDGDNLRHGLCADLGFSDADRIENIRRAGEVAKLMRDAGLIVLAAFISPFRSDRAMVRALFPPGMFLEVFVDAPLAVVEARDPKGLYRRARRGEIHNFTGLDSPYEPPEAAELSLRTAELAVEEGIERLLELLRSADRVP
jgi:bifunctional enzyme CysN/CysC